MLLLSIKRASNSRVLLRPKIFIFCHSFSSANATAAAAASSSPSYDFAHPSFRSKVLPSVTLQFANQDVVSSFRNWFKSRRDPLLDRIFEILKSRDYEDPSSVVAADLSLSLLNLRLEESLVLQVLKYGDDALSCLKFFDWAGRQPGYHHTRATFLAMFKVLSRAKRTKHMPTLDDFLVAYVNEKSMYRVRFYDTLVVGYAIAGKPEYALQLLGKMRFLGLDLNCISYNLLLNAVVEDGSFDIAGALLNQMKNRGYENEITQSLVVRSYCKQEKFNEAEEYVRGLMTAEKGVNEKSLRILVKFLCQNKRSDQASKLIGDLGCLPMDPIYGEWIRDLIQSGKPDLALEFLWARQDRERCIPDVFRYNSLIRKLLRENRLLEVLDLLMEMKELKVTPDKITMNTTLCFFCEAGMVDVSLELYNHRSEFALTPSSMVYNYLISTLCGRDNCDDAFRILKNSVEEGYTPSKKTLSLVADALCRAGQFDKMKQLIDMSLEHKLMPDDLYNRFIRYFCQAGRIEDGYMIYGQLNRIGKEITRSSYFHLVYGFIKLNLGDISARLLVEMLERGHLLSRRMVRSVVYCLLNMENPEKLFSDLVNMILSRVQSDCYIYNSLIDAAGHAKRPDLARQVFELMARNDVAFNLDSDILMLQSYLKNERIFDALSFFEDIRTRRKIKRKLCHCIIVGLCKANKPTYALKIYRDIIEDGLALSLQCYEELIRVFCSEGEYDTAIELFNEMERFGRYFTSFIGNIFLLHSLKSRDFYTAWVRSRDLSCVQPCSLMLGELVTVFSCRNVADVSAESLENVTQQCFPLDVFTYNMLIRRLAVDRIDEAVKLFSRMCKKGYEPDQWTFGTLLSGLFKHGRTAHAMQLEMMYNERIRI